MEDSVKTIFNNSATSRQLSHKTQVKFFFYFKVENMLMDPYANFNHEILQYPKENHIMDLMEKITEMIILW